MTNKQARDLGRPPGYAVEVGGGTDDDDVAFLADYRTCPKAGPYTYHADRAEYFEYLADARDRAAMVKCYTGLGTRVVEMPVAATKPPCRCCETPKPLLDHLREAGKAPVLTADDAFNAAVEHFREESDGDSLDALETALSVLLVDGRRYHLPCPQVPLMDLSVLKGGDGTAT